MGIDKRYRGVIVPMVTPFRDNGKIDLSAAERIVSHLVQHDTFPFILGTTGESVSIPNEERLPLVRSAVRVAEGRKMVYAGIGSLCVQDSIRAGRTYLDSGVGAVVAHLPSYYQLTPDQMRLYFEELADAIGGPVMIYNIPATTHMSIPIDVVKHLSAHPHIIGIKDSERDQDRLEALARYCASRNDCSHVTGWAAKSMYSLSVGSDGLVPSTGNVVPGLFAELYEAVLHGNMADAERLQQVTDTMAEIYQKGRSLGQSLAALKVMMSEKGLCEPYMLPPLTRLPQNEEASIRESVRRIPELING